MSFTVQDVIDAGFSKSAASRPETLNTPSKLIASVGYCLREVFQVASRENPYIIGTSADVDFDGSGWPRPADALRVIGVRATATTLANPALAVGAKVMVLPFDDKSFAIAKAALTELGQSFVPRGGQADPSGGALTMVYARVPTMPTALEDTIDAMFPDAQMDLLNYDMAVYLAEQDKRAEDQATFTAMKSALLGLYIGWAQAQTYEIVQRFPIVTPPLTNTAGGRQAPLAGG